MSLESLILKYGYGLLFVGAFLEGETVVLIAGFLAHQGYLQLPWLMIWAFLGTMAGDQAFYFLGRHRGMPFLEKWGWFAARRQQILVLLERYQVWLVFGYRFLYGIRNITPMVIGASGFPPERFFRLNLGAAALWVFVFGMLGYSFGTVLESLLGEIRHYEKLIILFLLAVAPLFWWVGRRRLRGRDR
jgi:membrane protein DedA with SNARE-associated domain